MHIQCHFLYNLAIALRFEIIKVKNATWTHQQPAKRRDKAMSEDNQQTLDNLDLRIIKEMGIDGRQSVSELAKKLNISRATVGKKLQRLLDENILKVAGIVLPGTLGYQTNAIIGINVIPKDIDSVADKLVSNENVHMMFISAGRHDIIIWALFRKSEDLSYFLRHELAQIPGITNTETMINLGIKKLSMSYLETET